MPDHEGFVVIYHPGIDAYGEVHESALTVHRDSGWQLFTDHGPVDIPPEPAPADPEYDPGQYTVADVLDYLATLNEEGREAVLALERDGKARTGILSETPDPDSSKES